MNISLKKQPVPYKKLHFIGIGGIGMSGIAKILCHMGCQISGSDLYASAQTKELESLGCQIFIGHAEDNIPTDCEAIVYTSAIGGDNLELAEAIARNIPIFKRAEMLGMIMKTRLSIGVAGAHGKTTTGGMISLMLLENELDPTIVIGGTLPQIASNSRIGNGDLLVAEADESDGTFLILNPTIAVVTNIEEDHMDYYKDFEDILAAFRRYLAQLPPEGFAIVNADCQHTQSALSDINCRVVSYSLEGKGDYNAGIIEYENGKFTAPVFEGEHFLGFLELAVPGSHNISNALAAVALGRQMGLSFTAIADSLAKFKGTGRRFEKLGEVNGVTVVDDYAHHPTEIKATLTAAKKLGYQRIVTVFQPHRYSRTQAMYADFAASFSDSDLTLINEIYPSFEPPIAGVSAKLIIDAAKERGLDFSYAATEGDVLDYLKQTVQKGDLVLIMGAGNILRAGERFVAEGSICNNQL